MRKIAILSCFIFQIAGFVVNAQDVKRDYNSKKDFANVFYDTQFTLFDLWSDEPIFPDKNGIYHIYYATNENKTPTRFDGDGKTLSGLWVYKFKNWDNCRDWCDGKVYVKPN